MQGLVARESYAEVKKKRRSMQFMLKGETAKITREVRGQQHETFFENWAHRFIVGRIRVKRSKGL